MFALPLRLRGELLLDVFLLLSKLFGRDTKKKRLCLIQRANGQVDPRLMSPLEEENITKQLYTSSGRCSQAGRSAGCCIYSSEATGFSNREADTACSRQP